MSRDQRRGPDGRWSSGSRRHQGEEGREECAGTGGRRQRLLLPTLLLFPILLETFPFFFWELSLPSYMTQSISIPILFSVL